MPRLVAESLATLAELPATFAWPPPASAREVAAFMARSLVPALAPALRLPWLRPGQETTARRLVTVLARHGAALLADPVGSGKTFVALAVAQALRQDAPVAIIVPAPLVEQWRQRATACGVPAEILSHVAVSRGHLPDPRARIVVIDESHHFRHPHTQRYAALARWVSGRPVLCVTATPVVNRSEDLAHQLLLGARDDALRAHGTASLRTALRRDEIPPALGELVIASPAPEGIPGRREERVRWDTEAAGEPPWQRELDALTLDRSGPVAMLIRGVLWGAAASSPAALRAALGRYALLLRQAADARRAGLAPDRETLRRFAAEIPEQLLLWELLPVTEVAESLPIEDLDRVERLRGSIDLAAHDPKVEMLLSMVDDGIPTLVFTTAVATVPYLRDRLAAFAPAWVTGAHAGWKQVRLPRARVLEWFRPGAAPVSPHILVASDVAAEGLDLQRASRVIHYDLPWTAMRLAQREGRSRRLGSGHAEIEVVRLEPPASIERRLRVGAVLRRKEGLLGRAGLSGDGAGWRWRHDLAAEWTGVEGRAGSAVVAGERERLLLVVEMTHAESGRTVLGHFLVEGDGGWAEDGAMFGEMLSGLRGRSTDVDALPMATDWRERCAPILALCARRCTDRDWGGAAHSAAVRALLDRAQHLLRQAARDRDREAMAALEGLIGFTARGHTAGEEAVLEALAAAPDVELGKARPGLRITEAGPGEWRVRVLAAVAEVPRGA